MGRQLTLYLLMLPLLASAQETGFVRLLVDPGHNFAAVVDGTRYEGRLLELPTGERKVSLWAPGRMVVDTTITVPAGRSIDLVIQLPHDLEYMAFAREEDRLLRRKRLVRSVPLVATIGAMVWTMTAIRGYNDAHAQLEADRAEYDRLFLPGSIRVLKDETMPAHKEDFKNARNGMYMASAVTALGVGATVYVFNRTARREKSVFDDKQKARFDGLAWMPSQVGGTWAVHLSFPLR